MRNARIISIILFLIFFMIAVGGGLFWANMNFVQKVSGGADFIGPWKAIRNLMMDGVTPYGELTTLNIQNSIYKRALLPGEFPYRVNLPLFILILFLPFGWISDLLLARAIWMIFLEVALVGVIFLSIRLAHWKPHAIFLILILIFSIFWLPSVAMLISGASIGLQALVIYGALRAIEVKSDEFAGGLAALSLLNVEATGLVFLLIVLWAFSAQRWRVLGGIGMMLAVLIGISLILMPSWILPFSGAVFSNWRSGGLPSTYGLLAGWMPGIGRRVAQMIAVGALTVLLIEGRAVRGKNVSWLFWTACLFSAVTPLLGMPYSSAFLVISLPAVILVVSVMIQRWGGLGLGGAVLIVLGLFFSLWGAQLQGYTSVFIFFYPIVLTLLLYWVRWSAVRPPQLWADQIAKRG